MDHKVLVTGWIFSRLETFFLRENIMKSRNYNRISVLQMSKLLFSSQLCWGHEENLTSMSASHRAVVAQWWVHGVPSLFCHGAQCAHSRAQTHTHTHRGILMESLVKSHCEMTIRWFVRSAFLGFLLRELITFLQ
jgi:hypothetical protein